MTDAHPEWGRSFKRGHDAWNRTEGERSVGRTGSVFMFLGRQGPLIPRIRSEIEDPFVREQ